MPYDASLPKPPKMTVSQVKVGDVLVRTNDHLGRPDERYRVTEIRKDGKRRFVLDGYWTSAPQYGSQLTAQNLSTVERDGAVVGRFFVQYW